MAFSFRGHLAKPSGMVLGHENVPELPSDKQKALLEVPNAAWNGVGWDMSPSGTELPIQNVCSSVANGGEADKICSMRVLRILTDSVDKVSDERVEALY